jgi:hypothetical protein
VFRQVVARRREAEWIATFHFQLHIQVFPDTGLPFFGGLWFLPPVFSHEFTKVIPDCSNGTKCPSIWCIFAFNRWVNPGANLLQCASLKHIRLDVAIKLPKPHGFFGSVFSKQISVDFLNHNPFCFAPSSHNLAKHLRVRSSKNWLLPFGSLPVRLDQNLRETRDTVSESSDESDESDERVE